MKPAKGKKYVKIVNGRKVSYGAKGYSIAPGTEKGNRYCSRSFGIEKKYGKRPGSPNDLSRKKWNCRGKKSIGKKSS